jgi:hypothetical protein
MGWPTTDDPRNKFVTVRLTENENDELEAHARAEGHKDRSAATRDALFRVIRADKRRRAKDKTT